MKEEGRIGSNREILEEGVGDLRFVVSYIQGDGFWGEIGQSYLVRGCCRQYLIGGCKLYCRFFLRFFIYFFSGFYLSVSWEKLVKIFEERNKRG